MNQTAKIQSTNAANEPLAFLSWGAFILFFFALQAVLWSVAITVTASDTSHAVVSGYDQEALRWDQTVAQQQASDALGWSAELKIDGSSDVPGDRKLVVVIIDASGAPLAGATVEVLAFHKARAARGQQLELKEIAPGIYSARLKVQHQGNWKIKGTASLAGSRLLFEELTYLKVKRK